MTNLDKFVIENFASQIVVQKSKKVYPYFLLSLILIIIFSSFFFAFKPKKLLTPVVVSAEVIRAEGVVAEELVATSSAVVASPSAVLKEKIATPSPIPPKKSIQLGDNQALVSYYDQSVCKGKREYGKNCGTASGQLFNEDALTVAHKTLKMGTRVEFRYNDKIVECVVNDRGPFIEGREFDLSKGCAKALGMRGLAVVFYRII